MLAFLKLGKERDTIKAFKRDEWSNIIDFLEAHKNSIKDYNEMESWPTLFDNFVEWVKQSTEFS